MSFWAGDAGNLPGQTVVKGSEDVERSISTRDREQTLGPGTQNSAEMSHPWEPGPGRQTPTTERVFAGGQGCGEGAWGWGPEGGAQTLHFHSPPSWPQSHFSVTLSRDGLALESSESKSSVEELLLSPGGQDLWVCGLALAWLANPPFLSAMQLSLSHGRNLCSCGRCVGPRGLSLTSGGTGQGVRGGSIGEMLGWARQSASVELGCHKADPSL